MNDYLPMPRRGSRAARLVRTLAALLALSLVLVAPTAVARPDRAEPQDRTVRHDQAMQPQGHSAAVRPASVSRRLAGLGPVAPLTPAARPAGQPAAPMTTHFTGFTQEALSISFALAPDAIREAVRGFGFAGAEFDAVLDACMAAGRCSQAEYGRRIEAYYAARGLALRARPGRSAALTVDVPQVVRQNRARVQPAAAALRRLAAARGADGAWTIEAAVAMVQSGIEYRELPEFEGGRRIIDFYPPPLALERGYGDCDTKSALLAALLQNLTRAQVVGVHVPDHYLIGLAATPQEGQAFIVHAGRPYVLIETSGPQARRPGEVGRLVQAALRSPETIRIDPML